MTMGTGDALKTIGQNSALRHTGSAWLSHALHELRGWLAEVHKAGRLGVTMDEFRASGRCPEPVHRNAWGALPKKAVRVGLIQPSHLTQKAKRLAAHARRVQVWNICPDAVA